MYRLLLVLLIAMPLGASAQALPGTDPLTLVVSPEYPRPYEAVTIRVESTMIDLAASTVVISVNGTVVEEGSGALSTSVLMGGPGTKSTIRATATENGLTYEAQVVLSPSDVALVVEPVSTTHPFYAGAALVAPEGRVRVIAIPDLRTAPGTRIPAESLVYTWKAGDKVLQSDSGIGRSVLSAIAPVRYRDAELTVTVSNQSKTVVAQTSAMLSPVDSTVRIYRNDPLLGVLYDAALPQSATLRGTEETFRVVPYYFESMPAIAWTVNGNASGNQEDVTVRVTGSGSGTASLKVSAKKPDTLQTASQAVSLRFGAARTGIFGF